MTIAITTLTLAYAAVAALLIHLNLRSPYSRTLKASAIAAVTALYWVSWVGINDLLGWASPEPLPTEFRLHWVTIDEPDKETGEAGTIFFWARELDEAGLPIGEPRAHRVTWDEKTAEAAQKALEQLEDGVRLNGRMSRQVIDPNEKPENEQDQYAGQGGSAGDQPDIEFIRAPPPALPPKGLSPV